MTTYTINTTEQRMSHAGSKATHAFSLVRGKRDDGAQDIADVAYGRAPEDEEEYERAVSEREVMLKALGMTDFEWYMRGVR